jgi:hypothetical protein
VEPYARLRGIAKQTSRELKSFVAHLILGQPSSSILAHATLRLVVSYGTIQRLRCAALVCQLHPPSPHPPPPVAPVAQGSPKLTACQRCAAQLSPAHPRRSVAAPRLDGNPTDCTTSSFTCPLPCTYRQRAAQASRSRSRRRLFSPAASNIARLGLSGCYSSNPIPSWLALE